MNIFENNLNLLSKNNPKLAEKIKKHTELTACFCLDESASGDPNLKKNDNFLHNHIDPEQEAIDLLQEVKNHSSACFNYIYGLGLGYVLKRFVKMLKGYVIVYEPDLDVLRLTLEMVDFTPELSNSKVYIFNDFDEIEAFYSKNFFWEIDISTTIQSCYKEHDIDNVKEFIRRLGYIHGIYDSNYRTYWQKHHNWVKSLISNINLFVKHNEVRVLKDKFKNKPAVIISAGPSLDKNIELIAKYQENFVIFCVSTALKSALKYGVKPDFICFLEYLPGSKNMIDEDQGKDSNIILQPITNKDIYYREAKNKFVFYADNDEVSKWAAKKFNILQKDYLNRGTVSVNALASAKIMGCNPIILTGQDLAYTDSKCYADGSIFEDFKLIDGKVSTENKELTLNKTKSTKEVLEFRFEELTKQLYQVKGQNGEMLSAPGDYASFIKYFTEIANIYGNTVKLINATEGGAQIDGYENMKFINVVEKFAKDPIVKDCNFESTNLKLQQKIDRLSAKGRSFFCYSVVSKASTRAAK